MFIKKLHIYHFGKFQNMKLDNFSRGLIFVHGKNEAGKSTLMSFIQCMLFGFPLKLTNEKRYEPRDGNRMGGSLTLITETHGELTIERVAGKAAGDVTVYLENGKHGGEEILQSVLKGVDRSFFQGIYSFNLDGLQEIEKISRDQLGNYLLGAGMTGSKELLELEAELDKRQSALFKPGGKKPLINEVLRELQIAEEEVVKWERKNEEFRPIAAELKRVKSTLEKLEVQKAKQTEQLYTLKNWKSIMPSLQKWKENEIRLSQLGEEFFPDNGLDRFERWQEARLDLDGDIAAAETKLKAITSEIQQLDLDHKVLEEEHGIESAGQKTHYLESLLNEEALLIQKSEQLNREAERLIHDTGNDWDEASIQKINTGLAAKNEWSILIKRQELLEQKKELMDQEHKKALTQLESAEARAEQHKVKVLPDEEFMRLRKQAEQEKSHRSLLIEKQELQLRISSAQLPSHGAGPQNVKAMVLLLAIGAVLVLYFIMNGEIAAAVLPAAILGISGFYLVKNRNEKEAGVSPEIQVPQLKKRLKEIEQQLGDVSTFQDLDRYSEQWEAAQAEHKELLRLQEEIKRLDQHYQQATKEYDKLELEEYNTQHMLQDWCEQNGYEGFINHIRIPGYIEKTEKLKGIFYERKQVFNKIEQIRDSIATIQGEAETLASALRIPSYHSHQEILIQARFMLQQEKEKQKKLDSLQETKRGVQELLEQLNIKKVSYVDEQEKLFLQAGVRDEEMYRIKGKQAEERRVGKEGIKQAFLHLNSLGYSEDEIGMLAAKLLNPEYSLDKELFEADLCLKECEKEIESLQGQNVELGLRLRQLEEEGTYSECLQRFETLRDVLQVHAKQWAVYRAAQDLLRKTKEQFHADRLPAIIKKAALYFAEITSGTYENLYLSEDQKGLIVERRDGVRFSPGELSRGTAEQLYLCVRLALASVYQKEGLPFIMDDVTVNFDPKRTKQTMDLLRKIGEQQQIIFFTCHEELLEKSPSVPVISLERKEKEPAGNGAFL